jgi:hypothetical protein
MSFVDPPAAASNGRIVFLALSAAWILLSTAVLSPVILLTFAACGVRCDDVAPLLTGALFAPPVALVLAILLVVFAMRRRAPLALLVVAGLADLALMAAAILLVAAFSHAF